MSEKMEHIVLGGGCFWCLEAVFRRLKGVVSTDPGYAGGRTENPQYKQVCSGTTGHAEVVMLDFDPSLLSLKDILEVFWSAHNPTTLNRQGNDIGSQYRSIILYSDEKQAATAQDSRDTLLASSLYPDPPLTEILPLKKFWPAEDYHKDYFENHGNEAYCRLLIAPKLRQLALDHSS